MKPEENEITREKGHCSITVFGLLGVLALTACSADKEEKVRFAKPAATKSADTSQGAAAENQTDFIMESYLAPEERLIRRQGRISSILESPAPAEPTAKPAP